MLAYIPHYIDLHDFVVTYLYDPTDPKGRNAKVFLILNTEGLTLTINSNMSI